MVLCERAPGAETPALLHVKTVTFELQPSNTTCKRKKTRRDHEDVLVNKSLHMDVDNLTPPQAFTPLIDNRGPISGHEPCPATLVLLRSYSPKISTHSSTRREDLLSRVALRHPTSPYHFHLRFDRPRIPRYQLNAPTCRRRPQKSRHPRP